LFLANTAHNYATRVHRGLLKHPLEKVKVETEKQAHSYGGGANSRLAPRSVACTLHVTHTVSVDPRLAYPRPRLGGQWPRLGGFKTKTLMSKTKTETRDLQDQYWEIHDW